MKNGSLRGICAWFSTAGMRPVATWKYAAAWPTPISDGRPVQHALQVLRRGS